jgi:outer membrane protein
MNMMRLLPCGGDLLASPARRARKRCCELYEAATRLRRHLAVGTQPVRRQHARGEPGTRRHPAAGGPARRRRNQVTDVGFDHPVTTDRTFTNQQAHVSASQPLYRPANLATYRQGERQPIWPSTSCRPPART